MIDVSPYMPPLNEMILQGDWLAQPPCWSTKFALESYQGGTKTQPEVLAMAEEAKLTLLDSYQTTGESTDTYSYNTTLSTLNAIIAEFSE